MSALTWLVPRQKVLFGLLVFLVGTFFLRALFFVSDNSNLHRVADLLDAENLKLVANRLSKDPDVQQKADNNQIWVPQFMQLDQQNFRLVPKNNIQMCTIEGNMAEFFTAVLCFVHDPSNFKQLNRSVYNETHENRLCKGINEVDKIPPNNSSSTTNKTEEEIKKSQLNLIVAVRDPLERFLSTFNRLCLRNGDKNACDGCGSNFTCLLDSEYKKAMLYSSKDAKDIELTDLDRVFFPQNWNCEFNTYLKNYTLLKIESKDEGNMKLLNDLFFKLREFDANNDDLTFIYKQINEPLQKDPPMEPESRIVEEAMLEAKLRNDPKAIKLLIQLYYHDFRLFDFELPPIGERK